MTSRNWFVDQVNHAHVIAIYFMHYNFVLIHQSLRITPAMAAKVTDRLWGVADMVKVLEAWEAAQASGQIYHLSTPPQRAKAFSIKMLSGFSA